MTLCYYSRMNAWKIAAIFSVCFMVFSAQKEAPETPETYKTRKNYYAAASARDLDLLARYEASGNKGAIRQMVKTKRLIPLGDQDVSVEQASPLHGTVVKVRPKGANQAYWTVKEAVVGGEKVVIAKKK